MGLDSLSLLLHLESEFDLTIRDEDTVRLCTVGQLYRYLLQRHGLHHPWPCPTVAVHRRLLQWLGSRHLHPRQDWWKLSAETGWPLPPVHNGLPYSCRTPAHLARAITLLQDDETRPQSPRVAIWRRLRAALALHFNLHPHQLYPHQHLIHDLGLD